MEQERHGNDNLQKTTESLQKKRFFSQAPNSSPRTEETKLEKVEHSEFELIHVFTQKTEAKLLPKT